MVVCAQVALEALAPALHEAMQRLISDLSFPGLSWALLDLIWAPPGLSWASPGLSWALLGLSWALLGSSGLSWALLGFPMKFKLGQIGVWVARARAHVRLFRYFFSFRGCGAPCRERARTCARAAFWALFSAVFLVHFADEIVRAHARERLFGRLFLVPCSLQ